MKKVTGLYLLDKKAHYINNKSFFVIDIFSDHMNNKFIETDHADMIAIYESEKRHFNFHNKIKTAIRLK